jgi:hypothetical protein
VPLSYVICPGDANPMDAQDEYTRVLWAASFNTPQEYKDNIREVYKTFLPRRTERHGLKRQVSDGNGRAAHLLFA